MNRISLFKKPLFEKNEKTIFYTMFNIVFFVHEIEKFNPHNCHSRSTLFLSRSTMFHSLSTMTDDVNIIINEHLDCTYNADGNYQTTFREDILRHIDNCNNPEDNESNYRDILRICNKFYSQNISKLMELQHITVDDLKSENFCCFRLQIFRYIVGCIRDVQGTYYEEQTVFMVREKYKMLLGNNEYVLK
jgi:hypothetical protein